MLPAAVATVAAPGGGVAAPADTVETREWTVPWEQTRPRDPIVDAAGRVWFVGQRGNYVGALDPTAGEFRRHELPERALPHNIIVGPDEMLWYAGNGDAHIGRMDPRTGEIVRRWAAPAEGGAPVAFHIAGNAADGDDSQFGDHIYAHVAVVAAQTSPPQR